MVVGSITLIQTKELRGDYMEEIIVYRCRVCNKHTMLFKAEVTHSEMESQYLTCAHDGRHKLGMIVCRKYDDLKECREQKYSPLI